MTDVDRTDPISFSDTALTRHAGIRVPLICGAMYPCSNPELVVIQGAQIAISTSAVTMPNPVIAIGLALKAS